MKNILSDSHNLTYLYPY